MFQALLKKQFLELVRSIFINRKNGQKRSKIAIIGWALLMVFLFVSISVLFVEIAMSLAEALLTTNYFSGSHNYGWLYFSMMAFIATVVGTIVNIFHSYTILYQGKDNEMLLSMPIPPSMILISRMMGLYITALLYTGVVWIPTIIIYYVYTQKLGLGFLYQILLLFLIPLFINTLSCLLGYGVAKVSNKVKNKNLVVTVASLVFFAVYYYFTLKLDNLISEFVSNALIFGATIQKGMFPLYHLGLAAKGNTVSMLITIGIIGGLFGLCCWIMSKSYLKILTTHQTVFKNKASKKQAQKQSVKKALLLREVKYFISSPAYMLNCGLGLIMMIAAAIYLLIKQEMVTILLANLAAVSEDLLNIIPLVLVAGMGMLLSTDSISAPSVSLEGKNIWIVKSLPIDTKDILNTKAYFHILMTLPVSVIATVLIGIALKLNVVNLFLATLVVSSYACFNGYFGLLLGIKFVNLDWVNPVVVIKQGIPIFISIFGGWAIMAAVFGGAYLARNLPYQAYLVVILLIFGILTVVLKHWVDTKGVKAFENL